MSTLNAMRENFLADICEHPDDDTPRLIFADWLDDHDDSDRAEFIRVQCELARWPCECDEVERVYHDECRCKEKGELQRRQSELLRQGYFAWSPFDHDFHKRHHQAITYYRGFILRVRCACAAWLEQGLAVVRCQPVQRVELSDKKPTEYVAMGGSYWRWFDGSRRDEPNPPDQDADELPAVLWQAMCDEFTVWEFLTEADAQGALSAACLRYAREFGNAVAG